MVGTAPGLVHLALLAQAAFAQEPAALPEIDDEALPEIAEPPAPAPGIEPYAAGHYWFATGLRGDVHGVAVTPGGDVLALDGRGAVWRAEGAGRWEATLRGALDAETAEDAGAPDEEEILLEVESLVEEGSTGEEAAARPEELGEGPALPDAEEAIQESERRRRGETESGAGRVVWASVATPGVAIGCRPDGCWRSTDGGRTWTGAEALPGASAFLDIGGGILAATSEGLRHSVDDGRTWIRVHDAVGSLDVRALATDERTVWAGTAQGLYSSEDGLVWTALNPPAWEEAPIVAIAADREAAGGLWVATPDALLRSDDGGRSLRRSSRNPLPGTRAILPLPEPGRALAAGDDGVWETSDGGLTWAPLADGLPGPEARALVAGPDGPLLASTYGLWRLTRGAGGQGIRGTPIAKEQAPPLGDVVEHALRRSGVSYDPLLLQKATRLARYLPRLTASVEYDHERTYGADFSKNLNDSDEDHDWFIDLELCFGGCGGTITVDAESAGLDFEQIDASDPDLASDLSELDDALQDDPSEAGIVVIDGEVFADDAGSVGAAAFNVAEKLARTRTALASQVAKTFLNRQALVAERAGQADLPLRERVIHELDVLEATAHLDVYTDGYFSRALDSGT